MSAINHIRARTLSAPNCSFRIGDRVYCRRSFCGVEFPARVVGRSLVRHIYDVETADGEQIRAIAFIRLDEDAQRLVMAAAALA